MRGLDLGLATTTTLFLAVTVLAGLTFLVLRRWGWFGVGLALGAGTAGVLDLTWTCIYFVR